MPSFRLGSLVGLLLLGLSTLFPAALHGFVSDDFNQPNIAPPWTFVNPRGDGSVRIEGADTGDARVLIAVPAGVEHDIWTDGVFTPRLMQPCADTDFTAEAKFVSGVKSKYQTQGILVELTDGVLRFELFGDGAGTRLYAAEIRNGTAVTRANRSIPGTPPLHLGVQRSGDRWQLSFSADGTAWSAGADFTAAASVTAIGVYAGNSGVVPPAHTAAIDYFFDAAAPVVPEDGVAGSDTLPPQISGIAVTPRTDGATVAWQTDEAAGGEVAYGTTSSCELGTVADAADPGFSHSVTLGSLRSDTLYYYRIEAWDADGNRSTSAVGTFRTAEPGSCRIDLWQGTVQPFGRPGVPQRWVNLLGDVAECPDIASLAYRLNGGAERALTIGPDGRRLVSPGDFNIDIDYTALVAGANEVEVIARDAYGGTTTESVQIDWYAGQTWPLPYSIDWATVDPVQEAAQIVDGRWAVEDRRAHPTVLGYDRILNFGDMKWRDYEVTVPITIEYVDPAGYNNISGSPGVGVQLRWNGHTTNPYSYSTQPLFGWLPVGATAWYGFGSKKFKLLLNGRLTAEDASGLQMQVGATYIFKVRVETLATGKSRYDFKFWDSRQTEPATWNLTGTGLTTDPTAGSVLLVAHHVDAHFGQITVLPLGSADSTAPTIGGIAASAQATGGTVVWTTDEPAKGALAYGLTSACADGRLEETAYATAHSATLGGLKSDTLYYYRIEARDAAGNLATSSTRSFHTLAASSSPTLPVSDEFGDSSLNAGLWTFVNPLGDAAVALSGGRAAISVPAGREHDLWTAGNFAPRLLQAAPAGDFEVAAKFDSSVLARYQMQGIVVEAEPGTFLRCELMGDGTATRLFVAAVRPGAASVKVNQALGGGAPRYLRVKRAGSGWSVSWSADGSSWTAGASFTDTLAPTAVGVYAGNAGSNPAHTAQIDWFRNTGAPSAPVDSTAPPTLPVSDEFGDSSLNAGLWTFVNPLGDAAVALSGGRAAISVPAGREHDLWTAGNFAPRLLQAAPAGDFEVAAKFDSPVLARYQMQGIVVEAEPGTFLRCELMGDGTATRLFVAAVRPGAASVKVNQALGGGAPKYLRVKRAGSGWSVSWSADGSSWTAGASFTDTLAPTAVGVYAGNAGSSPAHTAQIDWFRRLGN